MGSKFDFGRRIWVWKDSKFRFSGFEPGFGLFAARHVRSLGFLEGFEWVRSLGLVDEPEFE